MIKLGGFSASNYYNKVKLALLEKAVPFEESLQWPSGDVAVRANSPLGKIPFCSLNRGPYVNRRSSATGSRRRFQRQRSCQLIRLKPPKSAN